MLSAHPGALARRRPVMLAVAGDSAAGKTTLTRGLVDALGADRVTAVCVDDYHRYERSERHALPFTPLHPACNYVGIMEQHLQMLATGQPVLKPVYDHAGGTLGRPVLIEPREHVIADGLLPLHTRLSRACFDVSVYLEPPEAMRRRWKLHRDCTTRGATPEGVMAELARREPDSAAFVRPQRRHADVVVRWSAVSCAHPATPLSVELLLRPTLGHPDLRDLLDHSTRRAVQLALVRDADGKPVDALEIRGDAPRGVMRSLEHALCAHLDIDPRLVDGLGHVEAGVRSDALAITQLLLLHRLATARRLGDGGAVAGMDARVSA